MTEDKRRRTIIWCLARASKQTTSELVAAVPGLLDPTSKEWQSLDLFITLVRAGLDDNWEKDPT